MKYTCLGFFNVQNNVFYIWQTFFHWYVHLTNNAYIIISQLHAIDLCALMSKLWGKIISFINRICYYLFQVFFKVMKGLRSKRKRLNISDKKGRIVNQSLCTRFALTKNYKIKIHQEVDDVDPLFYNTIMRRHII